MFRTSSTGQLRADLQAAEPWTGYRHHSRFKGTLPAAVVVMAEALSAFCLLVPALLLLRGMPPPPAGSRGTDSAEFPLGGLPNDYRDGSVVRVEGQQLGRCVAASGVMAAMWVVSTVAAGRGGSYTRQELTQLAWLPALPLAFAGMALSVARSQASSALALAALQAQMYHHEKP
mmetsp:Transcript_5344/g.15308  ORF Transcript_5344/g.15308 Transcript_5344/m.15308 type:complete len:174 (+) Transcript_5344:1122-1643(+)